MPGEIEIVWDGDRAEAISVPGEMVNALGGADSLHVRMKTVPSVHMLGSVEVVESRYFFRPLVPLTRGLTYEILLGSNVQAEVTIPLAGNAEPPGVVIYPSQDTVPENLLKVYLKFSRPMQEGSALKHLLLQNSNGDTMRNVFLDLKPELWNASHDILTVWLDPGRIKRGLHPNQQLGQPLVRGQHYLLSVLSTWKDIDGVSLGKAVHKEFFIGRRDSLSPVPSHWIMALPDAHATDVLCINFGEPLDFGLSNVALHLADASGKYVAGKWTTGNGETTACFIPESAWSPGKYALEIETRLEDLAGNNINRPFEVDISQVDGARSDLEVVTIPFEIPTTSQ